MAANGIMSFAALILYSTHLFTYKSNLFTFQYPPLRLPIRSKYPVFLRKAISRLAVASERLVFSQSLSLLRLLSSENICRISFCLSVKFIGSSLLGHLKNQMRHRFEYVESISLA